MKRLSLTLILLTLLMASSILFAQDSYFTQFDTSPAVTSPALTGNFDGKLRVNTNYRTQWGLDNLSRVTNFRTYALSTDTKFNLGPKTQLGVGLSYLHDLPTGSLDFERSYYQLNTAIHQSIGNAASYNNILSLGISTGLGVHRMKAAGQIWSSQHEGNGGNGGIPGVDPEVVSSLNDKASFANFSLGGLWTLKKNETHFSSQVGFTVHGFNGRKSSFVEGSEVTSHPMFISFVLVEVPLAERASLIPTLHFVKQGGHEQLLYGVSPRYYFGEKSRFVQLGIFGKTRRNYPTFDYRFFDISSTTLRIDMGSVALGFTYEQFFFNDLGFEPALEFSLGYRLQ